jgi:hypothetical protein
MGLNPMESAGCFSIIKALQKNPNTKLELIDFSVNSQNDSVLVCSNSLSKRAKISFEGNNRGQILPRRVQVLSGFIPAH